MIAHRRANAHEALFPDMRSATDRRPQSKKAMRSDPAIMADNRSAPDRYIIPDVHERLDHRCFKNEAMFADLGISVNVRFWADIARHIVAHSLRGFETCPAKRISLRVSHRDEAAMIFRRIQLDRIFEIYQR